MRSEQFAERAGQQRRNSGTIGAEVADDEHAGVVANQGAAQDRGFALRLVVDIAGTGTQVLAIRRPPQRSRIGIQEGVDTYTLRLARNRIRAIRRWTTAITLWRSGRRTKGKATSWNMIRTSSPYRALRHHAQRQSGTFFAFQPNAWGTYCNRMSGERENRFKPRPSRNRPLIPEAATDALDRHAGPFELGRMVVSGGPDVNVFAAGRQACRQVRRVVGDAAGAGGYSRNICRTFNLPLLRYSFADSIWRVSKLLRIAIRQAFPRPPANGDRTIALLSDAPPISFRSRAPGKGRY